MQLLGELFPHNPAASVSAIGLLCTNWYKLMPSAYCVTPKEYSPMAPNVRNSRPRALKTERIVAFEAPSSTKLPRFMAEFPVNVGCLPDIPEVLIREMILLIGSCSIHLPSEGLKSADALAENNARSAMVEQSTNTNRLHLMSSYLSR